MATAGHEGAAARQVLLLAGRGAVWVLSLQRSGRLTSSSSERKAGGSSVHGCCSLMPLSYSCRRPMVTTC